MSKLTCPYLRDISSGALEVQICLFASVLIIFNRVASFDLKLYSKN